MVAKKTAAIGPDEIREKRLSEISAADFLATLDQQKVTFQVWPEKKKVELWQEPENWQKVDVGTLIDILRGEKKKLELEKHPGFERWQNPLDQVINPEVYDQLVDRLVRDVSERIRRA